MLDCRAVEFHKQISGFESHASDVDSNVRQARRLFSKTRLQMLLVSGDSMTVGTTPVARRNATELRVAL